MCKKFRYNPVDELPAEAASWREEHDYILKSTRGSRNMTPEEEDLVKDCDNGQWDNDEIWHHCTPIAR